MKFWARNGEYNWICDFSEYQDTKNKDIVKVTKTYLSRSFWDAYDGKNLPTSGTVKNKYGRERAYGFEA